MKNVHGYGRASAYGIENMQMQGGIAIFTVNLKKILKLEVVNGNEVNNNLIKRKYAYKVVVGDNNVTKIDLK